ncbi:Cyclin-y-like protein [Globisporangium polare]
MATPFYRFVKYYGPPDSEASRRRISPASSVREQKSAIGRLRPLSSSSKETSGTAAASTTSKGSKTLHFGASEPVQQPRATDTTSCKRRWWQRRPQREAPGA